MGPHRAGTHQDDAHVVLSKLVTAGESNRDQAAVTVTADQPLSAGHPRAFLRLSLFFLFLFLSLCLFPLSSYHPLHSTLRYGLQPHSYRARAIHHTVAHPLEPAAGAPAQAGAAFISSRPSRSRIAIHCHHWRSLARSLAQSFTSNLHFPVGSEIKIKVAGRRRLEQPCTWPRADDGFNLTTKLVSSTCSYDILFFPSLFIPHCSGVVCAENAFRTQRPLFGRSRPLPRFATRPTLPTAPSHCST